jgi:hypothetical protein
MKMFKRRKDLVQTLKKLRFYILITGRAKKENIRDIDDLIEDPLSINRDKYKELVSEKKKVVKNFERDIGKGASAEELNGVISHDEEDIGSSQLLGIEDIDEYIDISSYSENVGYGGTFPAHAWIIVNPFGVEGGAPGPRMFQLDESLFCDMASLCNQTQELCKSGYENRKNKMRAMSLSHSTLMMIFSFIEGYLNCLGFCMEYYERHRNEEELIKLRDKNRNMGIYEKVKEYLKIEKKKEHPPITKGDNKKMEKICKLRSEYRHSIIHPRPHRETVRPSDVGLTGHGGEEKGTFRHARRQINYLNTTPSIAFEACDAVVDLIFDIEEVLGWKYSTADTWLCGRNENGMFPSDAFPDSAGPH